jgi:acylphosphatase
MDEVVRHFLVTGKVQGVFFRQSARREAERLCVRGSARNLPDGSVEIWAQGSAAAVDALHEWLKSGPTGARVDAVRESSSGEGGAPQIPRGFAVS